MRRTSTQKDGHNNEANTALVYFSRVFQSVGEPQTMADIEALGAERLGTQLLISLISRRTLPG